MQSPEGSFLHSRNPNFHKSDEVEGVAGYLRAGGEAIPNQPSEKIAAHLGFLANEEYVNDGILTGDPDSIERQVEANVIQAERVPESYFDLQRRIAREQGHGDVYITDEMREQMTGALQADQRAGLKNWAEYLSDDDAGYPNWFKHYAWESMTKLGGFDKEEGKFEKRSRGTTAPYPDLNREALAYVYDVLDKSKIQGEKVDGGENDEQLQKLLQGANFGKLYAHAVLECTPASKELLASTKGSWMKYDKIEGNYAPDYGIGEEDNGNSGVKDETALKLAHSLQGHGTGWCTAGEATAAHQLSTGDFYVYYTRDEDGKDTIPRIAIRMEKEMFDDEMKVAEVRGINAAQELEAEMADIATEQLHGLPGGGEYIRKAEDMKRLTALDKKIAANPQTELSNEEIIFIYELDHKIEGFGYSQDPRIGEIRVQRGERDKSEIARVFPETIREQLSAASAAYKNVAEQLFSGNEHKEAATSGEIEQLFATKDKEWQENGVYEYIFEQFTEHGNRFKLLATPNVAVSTDELIALVKDFGEQQPEKAMIDYGGLFSLEEESFGEDRYNAHELSGNDSSGDPVRFSLMEDHFDKELNSMQLSDQKRTLQKRQKKTPELSIRVPSPLDAVTNWYKLRTEGDKLDDGDADIKTFVRHFNLPAQEEPDGSLRILDSSIGYRGGPELESMEPMNHGPARLAIG